MVDLCAWWRVTSIHKCRTPDWFQKKNCFWKAVRQIIRGIWGADFLFPFFCVLSRVICSIHGGRFSQSVQGGEDLNNALSCRSFIAKEPLITELFCRKWLMNTGHPMTLRHPVPSNGVLVKWFVIRVTICSGSFVPCVLFRFTCTVCAVDIWFMAYWFKGCASDDSWYGVATISRLLKMIGLFCRISPVL